MTKDQSQPEGFSSLSESEQRAVAERLLRTKESGWRPFWCADPNCDGKPHWLVTDDGDGPENTFVAETDLVGPNGEPLSEVLVETPEGDLIERDEDGNEWAKDLPVVGRAVLNPKWSHNHARKDQRLPSWARRWILFVMSGRGAGKALALDTPIPTPTGWTTMGDLEVGDRVIDMNGKPTRVTMTTPVQHNRDCFLVTFSDGSTLVADRDHQWITSTHAQRKTGYRNGRTPETSVVTTDQILDTLRYGKRGDLNHCVWVNAPLALPTKRLAVDPYTLGAWLGDGTSTAGEITIHDSDVEEMRTLLREPLGGSRRKDGANCATYALGSRPPKRDALGQMTHNDSLHSRLKDLGLLRNKHVPSQYLRASADQRLALLRGLMDTDGYADPRRNGVEFCSTNERLARGVLELALSLGQKAVLREGRATLHGVDKGPKFRVCWAPTIPVFGLRRKADRIRYDGAQAVRSKHRMIVSVEPVASVPVRCITVASDTESYLAGEQMIVTHNTRTGVEFVTLCARKGLDGAILGRRGTELVNTHVAEIIANAHPDFVPVHFASKDILVWPEVTLPDGSKKTPTTYLFSAEKPENIRSVNLSYAWVDEAAFMDEIETAWMNLKLATRVKSPGNPIHMLITSTPTGTPWVIKMEDDPDVEVRRVSTYANRANLDPEWLAGIEKEHEGTRMGRQELHGEVLRDVEGALWNDGMFTHHRCATDTEFDDLIDGLDDRVVAVDPAGSKGKRSDATGIIGAGAHHFDDDGSRLRSSRFSVVSRATIKGTPNEWAEQVFKCARLIRARRIVAEKNFGGDMVKQVLQDYAKLNPDTTCDENGEAFKIEVVHAVKSKETRAEATVGKYEQGRVCVDGDALVPTQRGLVPLREVSRNDSVLTRAGLRRVTATWDQGVRDVVEVITTEGSTVMTADHEVFTSNRGWVHACTLVPTDTLVAWKEYASTAGLVRAAESRSPDVTLAPRNTCGEPVNQSERFKSTGGFGTTSKTMAIGEPDGTAEANSCTGLCGSQSEGRFLTVGTSTTETTTQVTTPWTTLSQSLRVNTVSTITRLVSALGVKIKRTHRRVLARLASGLGSFATTAASSAAPTSRAAKSTATSDSAHQPVTLDGGIVSVRDAGKRHVYDISVEEHHEFFANGILVHNCHVTSTNTFGDLSELEKQQVTWVPKSRGGRMPSPNDIDALVWAVRSLESDIKFDSVSASASTVKTLLKKPPTTATPFASRGRRAVAFPSGVKKRPVRPPAA